MRSVCTAAVSVSVSVAMAWTARAWAAEPAIDPAKQFDLICDVAISEWWDKATGPFHGTYHRPKKHDTFRLVIDLKAMRYCDVLECREWGATALSSYDGKILIAHDSPSRWTYHFDTGRYRYWKAGDGIADLIQGRCRKVKFSGLDTAPPVSR